MVVDTKQIWALKQAKYITAYHKGFHKLIRIYESGRYNGDPTILAEYKQVFNSEGKPFKGKVYVCNVLFCHPVTRYMLKELQEEHQVIIDNFEKMKKKL